MDHLEGNRVVQDGSRSPKAVPQHVPSSYTSPSIPTYARRVGALGHIPELLPRMPLQLCSLVPA